MTRRILLFVALLMVAFPAVGKEPYVCNEETAEKAVAFLVHGKLCTLPSPMPKPSGTVVPFRMGEEHFSLHLTSMTLQQATTSLYEQETRHVLEGVMISCRKGPNRIVWTRPVHGGYPLREHSGISPLCPESEPFRERYLQTHR